MHRRLIVIAAVALALLAVPAMVLAAWQSTLDGVLDGVTVDGDHVGGLARTELEPRIEEVTRDALDQPVTVRGERGEVESTRGDAGVVVDTTRAADAAWRRGRQRNPLAALADHARVRLGETIPVDAEEEIDDATLEEWARDVAEELSAPRRNATVRFHADAEPPGDANASRAEPVQPAPGHAVDAEALAERARETLLDGGEVDLEAPGDEDAPVTTQADLDAILPEARRAASRGVRLRHPVGRGEDLRLSSADVAAVLRVDVDETATEGQRLSLRIPPDVLRDHLGEERIAALNVAPRDATFAVDGDDVSIRGGTPGYRFAPEAVARAVLERAVSTERVGDLPGRRPQPDFSRADARELGIKQAVSDFTTEHACCEPRVTNIHRIADIVDGAIVRSGESFSLNEHVGRRTREKGFVPGGVIEDGEFEEAVGGGISQFATTFFNAAFFAGIQIDAFQPHSYYISRYPMGHESTIAYGVIDVAITNDSPHAILIKTSYTDTSITVRFFSTPWADVEVQTSGRRNVVEGDVRDGFDVSFTRRITYPDGSEEVEEYFHRYEPENADDG